MNQPARRFSHLIATWHQDAAGDEVDVLAADFVASVASHRGPVCVGIIRSDAMRRLFGLACFVSSYGLTLRPRYLKDRAYVFVFAEIQSLASSSDYAGAVVLERPLHLERVAA